MKTVRGRVQRDTSQGEGLVFAEGRQIPFKLETAWKSEMAPTVNMVVDVDLDDEGNLLALRAVSAQAAASETAAKAFEAAQGTAKELAGNFQEKGLPVLKAMALRIGYPILGCWLAVVLGWFFFAAYVVKSPFIGELKLTFYQSLTLLNASGEGLAGLLTHGGAGAGFYGFLAWLSLALVFLPQVWVDKRAHLGLAAPLAMMLITLLIVYFKMKPDTSQAAEMMGNDPKMRAMMEKMAEESAKAARDAFSIGLGVYLAGIASAYLAWLGLMGFRRP